MDHCFHTPQALASASRLASSPLLQGRRAAVADPPTINKLRTQRSFSFSCRCELSTSRGYCRSRAAEDKGVSQLPLGQDLCLCAGVSVVVWVCWGAGSRTSIKDKTTKQKQRQQQQQQIIPNRNSGVRNMPVPHTIPIRMILAGGSEFEKWKEAVWYKLRNTRMSFAQLPLLYVAACTAADE